MSHGKGMSTSPPQVTCPQAEKAGHASTLGQEDEPELYKADDFRMYCMKVRAPYGHPSRHTQEFAVGCVGRYQPFRMC